MLYIVWAVIIAIAVVLGIFTGVWGGLVWIVAAAVVMGGLFIAKARGTTVERASTEPTGVTRPAPSGSSSGAETANERVGQT
jgi:uncharacterized protein (DUF58 family)